MRLITLLIIACLVAPVAASEREYNKQFCDRVGGQTEVKHSYGHDGRYVLVDCETDDAVYEGGLDKRSSLDSIQQALFFADLSGKKPIIVIYDTGADGGAAIIYRIQTVAHRVGVKVIVQVVE